MMPKEPMVTISGFDVPADSVAVAMMETWKQAGGTYKDLWWKALMYFSASGEFRRGLMNLGAEQAAGEWRHEEA
jgi:hypothetical protein